MITFLAVDGLLFVVVLILIELRLWERFCDFCCSLYPASIEETGKRKTLFFLKRQLKYFFASRQEQLTQKTEW